VKNITVRNAAATVACALILSACGGGGGGGSLPSTNSQQTANTGSLSYTGPASLAVTWASKYVQEAQYVGPVTKDVVIGMNVALTPQNASGLFQYAQSANDPKNASYRHFLTAQEIGERYGATPTNYANVAAYFRSYGLSVGGWPQHLILAVSGTTTAFGKAFGTSFGWYKLGKRTFLGPVSAPHLMRAEPIMAVAGLAQIGAAHTYIIRVATSQTTGYSPQQLARGFDFSGPYSNGINGSGITVGIIGTGPIMTGSNGDVAALGSAFGAKMASVTLAPVVAQTPSSLNNNTGTAAYDPAPGGLSTPPPVTDPNVSACTSATPTPGYNFAFPNYQACNPEDGEAQLDTESVASLAPGSNVLFYLAYNGGTCVSTSTGDFYAATNGVCSSGDYVYEAEGLASQYLQISDDEIQQAISDNTADVLSLSYGEGEIDEAYSGYFGTGSDPTQGPGPLEFAALSSEGIAVFVSSGDTGNEACVDPITDDYLTTPCVSYPASDPHVTAVGGVNIPLNSAGTLVGQITAWGYQTTAGGDGSFNNNVGSGGGLSQYFMAPTWQSGLTVASNSNPTSSQLNGYRAVPDIAMDADWDTGPAMVENAAFSDARYFGPVGGTSAAAPEMAAAWALVLQACKASSTCATAWGAKTYRLGNAASVLYAIYNGNGKLPYAQTIYDVLYGENQANGAGATPGPPITGCCTAGPGYDMVTGVGAPMIGHLIQSVTGTTEP
jgi:subtilase family serine protease